MVMINKDLNKRNFLNWYCWYATPEEIKRAKMTNRAAVERLVSEYSYEIERINKSKRFYEVVSMPKGTIRKFNLLSHI